MRDPIQNSMMTSLIQPRDATAGAAGRAQRSVAQRLRQSTRALALALAATLLLASCSSIKMGYNNADTLVLYSLNNYLDLDDAQDKLARERVRELLTWHRSTQLPTYSRFLDETERKLGQGQVSAEEVLAFQQAMNDKMLKVGEHAAPELARLALTLTPAQITHFADKLAKDSSKARREFAKTSGKQTLDDRVKAYADRTETWLGSLSKEQLALVRSALAERPSGQQMWMEERERRQRDLVAVLRRIVAEHPSELIAASWLREYFVQLAQPADEARRASVLDNRRANAQLVAQLINTATPAQRATLSKKLRGYSQDFTTLASSSGGRG